LELQHRTQDFTFILGGITGILEQQMATMNNLLPGAKKSVPYVNETGKFLSHARWDVPHVSAVLFFWKMIELNKVGETTGTAIHN
jgi:hypothetical protein